jgi:putative ABC transport system permease protein
MLKSIFTTAIRNIFRNRSFSIINLIGLSVSMSLALLVIVLIREQYTYDNFHRDADRIYRVNTRAIRVSGGEEDYASVPYAMGQALKEDYTFTDEVVRVNRNLNGDAVYGKVNVPLRGLLVDPSFLTVFNFPLEKGNPSTALSAPNNLVITKATAERIFGRVEPLGQTLTINGYGEFVVTGVLKEIANKTHFEFEALGSSTAIPAFEQQHIVGDVQSNWNDYYSTYVYFKLKKGKDPKEVEDALAKLSKDKYANLKLETRDKGYNFFLLKLSELTPGPLMSNSMGSGMPVVLILLLSALVFIVMLMACFNYTNLMIAKSLSRAREIGVRKVVGAQRFQVFFQFIGEAVIFSLLCLAISYLLLQVLKPGFMQLHIAREFETELKEDYLLYGYFLLFAVVVGIIAGALPAAYLSAFKASRVLKDSGNLKVYSRLTFRKVLIITQFALSIIFIIVVLVIDRQVNFMVSTSYGINDKNILNVRLQGLDHQKFANEAKSLPGVTNVGGVSHRLGTWADRASDYKRNLLDEAFVMRDFIVDDNYVNNLNMVFLAGENFNPDDEGSIEKHVILNEQALPLFGFSSAISAIGQSIFVEDSTQLVVKGVVKDFNFRPLSYQIGPVAFRFNRSELAYASLKIVPGQKEAVVSSIESIWKKLDPIHPLEWKMMEEEIDEAYEQGGFFDVLNIVGYISFLAISLACLGMLGMAMYATQTRLKEIGVRKVLGATSEQLTIMLSRSFLILMGIASLIGIPAGYFLGELFLSQYAYKIEITALLILSGLLTVSVLGFLVIASQTWKAASLNPVKSLRYE